MASASYPLSSGPTASPQQSAAPMPQSAPMSGKMADDLQGGGEEAGQKGGQNGARLLISKIREMETSVTEMARQFPSAAQASRQVQEGLRAMLRQIVANPGGNEPPSPEGEDA
jgi:hypothetical protein